MENNSTRRRTDGLKEALGTVVSRLFDLKRAGGELILLGVSYG